MHSDKPDAELGSFFNAFDYAMRHPGFIATTLVYLAVGIAALPFYALMRMPDEYLDLDMTLQKNIEREQRAYPKDFQADRCAGCPHMN